MTNCTFKSGEQRSLLSRAKRYLAKLGRELRREIAKCCLEGVLS